MDEVRAILGKSDEVMAALKGIERSPFAIQSFNSDNGSEFLNLTS